MSLKDCCFIGKGALQIRKRTTFCPTSAMPNPNEFFPAGNVSQFQLEISENVINQKDYTSGTGGIDCSVREIEDIQLNMSFKCYSIQNLAIALLGENTEVTTPVAVVAEPHTVQAECEYFPLLQMVDLTLPVIVTDAAATAYVAGTDYIVTATGILLPEGSTIAPGTELLIDYTPIAQDCLDLFQTIASDYELVLHGVNQADQKPFLVHLFNVKISPTSQADFIGDGEFATLELTGSVQKDNCRVNASGLERYGVFKRGISA